MTRLSQGTRVSSDLPPGVAGRSNWHRLPILTEIAKLLGTTKHITAPDSRTFAKEISKYIDSKDQKRGDKKDKKKGKDKGKDKDKDKKKEKEKEEPAYWPLIRQVCVWCNAKALSTGAILVDLPGVADANAARNNIAKDYMKKCDCVWILAPITRAVDDKTARGEHVGRRWIQRVADGAG